MNENHFRTCTLWICLSNWVGFSHNRHQCLYLSTDCEYSCLLRYENRQIFETCQNTLTKQERLCSWGVLLLFPPCLWTLGPERSVAPWALRNLGFLCWQKAGGGPSPWSWTGRLPTEEKGRKHTQRDNHWGFLHPSGTVWPETSLLCCFFSHTLTTCLSSRTGTLYSMTVDGGEEMTYKCGRLCVLSCLVTPVRTGAGS